MHLLENEGVVVIRSAGSHNFDLMAAVPPTLLDSNERRINVNGIPCAIEVKATKEDTFYFRGERARSQFDVMRALARNLGVWSLYAVRFKDQSNAPKRSKWRFQPVTDGVGPGPWYKDEMLTFDEVFGWD